MSSESCRQRDNDSSVHTNVASGHSDPPVKRVPFFEIGPCSHGPALAPQPLTTSLGKTRQLNQSGIYCFCVNRINSLCSWASLLLLSVAACTILSLTQQHGSYFLLHRPPLIKPVPGFQHFLMHKNKYGPERPRGSLPVKRQSICLPNHSLFPRSMSHL